MIKVWDEVCCPSVGKPYRVMQSDGICVTVIVKAMTLALTRVPCPPLTVAKKDKLACCCLRMNSRTCRICWCIGIGHEWEQCRTDWIKFSESVFVDIRPCLVGVEKQWVSNLLICQSVCDVFHVGRRMNAMTRNLGKPCDERLRQVINRFFCIPSLIPTDLASCLSEILAKKEIRSKSIERENWVKDIKSLRSDFSDPITPLPDLCIVPCESIVNICNSKWSLEKQVFSNACKFPEIDAWLKSTVYQFIFFFNNPTGSHTLCQSVFERFYFRVGYEDLSLRLFGLLNEWAPKKFFCFSMTQADLAITFDIPKLLNQFSMELVSGNQDIENRVFGSFQSMYMSVFRLMASVEYGYYCVCVSWKIIRYWLDCRELYGLWWRVLNGVRNVRNTVFSRSIRVVTTSTFSDYRFDVALGEHGRVIRGMMDGYEDIVGSMHVVVELRYALSRLMKFDHHHEEVLRIVRRKVEELEKFHLVV